MSYEHELFVLIQNNDQQLKKAQASFLDIVDDIEEDVGFWGALNTQWKSMPFWLRVSSAVVLCLSLIVIGIATQSLSGIIFSFISSLLTSGVALLLENHQLQQQKKNDTIKTKIEALTGLLTTMIQSLQTSAITFKQEIDTLSLQNKKLNQSINVLNTQLKHMDDEINTLSQTNSGLEQDKARLRTGVDDLQQHLKQAAIELQKAEATLQSARNEHDSILLQLREKVTQLDQSEKQLSFEVKKASTVQLSLDETIDILSKSVITDGQQRAEFMEKLRELITNKDAFFTNAAKRILDAENELTRVTKELEQTNQHYKALISEYETQIDELKTIVTKDKQDPMVDIRPPIGRNSLFYLRPTINSGLPSSDCYTAPL